MPASLDRSISQLRIGSVDGSSTYKTLLTLIGRRNRTVTVRVQNGTTGTVTILLQEGPDVNTLSPLESYYETIVPGGVVVLDLTWQEEVLVVQAVGTVAGSVTIEEYSPSSSFSNPQ